MIIVAEGSGLVGECVSCVNPVLVCNGCIAGHKQAASLAALNNISVTLIPESAVYAIMSRVNKVIFGVNVIAPCFVLLHGMRH